MPPSLSLFRRGEKASSKTVTSATIFATHHAGDKPKENMIGTIQQLYNISEIFLKSLCKFPESHTVNVFTAIVPKISKAMQKRPLGSFLFLFFSCLFVCFFPFLSFFLCFFTLSFLKIYSLSLSLSLSFSLSLSLSLSLLFLFCCVN